MNIANGGGGAKASSQAQVVENGTRLVIRRR